MNDTDASEDYIDDLVDFEARARPAEEFQRHHHYEPSESAPDSASYIDNLDSLSERIGLTPSVARARTASVKTDVKQTAEEARRVKYEEWLREKERKERDEKARLALVPESKRVEKEKRITTKDDGSIAVFVPQLPVLPKAHQPIPVLVSRSKAGETKIAEQKAFVRKMVKRDKVNEKALPSFWPLIPDIPKAAQSATTPALVRKPQKRIGALEPIPKPSPLSAQPMVPASSSSSSKSDWPEADKEEVQLKTKRQEKKGKATQKKSKENTVPIRSPVEPSPAPSIRSQKRSVPHELPIATASPRLSADSSSSTSSESSSASLVANHHVSLGLGVPPDTAAFEGLWMSGGLMPEIHAPRTPPKSADGTRSSTTADDPARDLWVGTALAAHTKEEAMLRLPLRSLQAPGPDSPRVRTMSTSANSSSKKSRRPRPISKPISEVAAHTIASVRRSTMSNRNVSTSSRAAESVDRLDRPQIFENIIAQVPSKTRTPNNDKPSAPSMREVSQGTASPVNSLAVSTAYHQPTVESVASNTGSSKNSEQYPFTPVPGTLHVEEESWARHDDFDTAINEWRKTSSNNVSPAEAKKLLKKLAGTAESTIGSAQSIDLRGKEAAAVPLPESTPTSDSHKSSRSSNTWHILQPEYPMAADITHGCRTGSSLATSSYSWHAMQARYPLSSTNSKRSTPIKGASKEAENCSEISNKLDEAEVSRRVRHQTPSGSHKRIVEDEPYYAVIDGVRRHVVRYRLGSESGMT